MVTNSQDAENKQIMNNNITVKHNTTSNMNSNNNNKYINEVTETNNNDDDDDDVDLINSESRVYNTNDIITKHILKISKMNINNLSLRFRLVMQL